MCAGLLLHRHGAQRARHTLSTLAFATRSREREYKLVLQRRSFNFKCGLEVRSKARGVATATIGAHWCRQHARYKKNDVSQRQCTRRPRQLNFELLSDISWMPPPLWQRTGAYRNAHREGMVSTYGTMRIVGAGSQTGGMCGQIYKTGFVSQYLYGSESRNHSSHLWNSLTSFFIATHVESDGSCANKIVQRAQENRDGARLNCDGSTHRCTQSVLVMCTQSVLVM